jgi:hypothetical protein
LPYVTVGLGRTLRRVALSPSQNEGEAPLRAHTPSRPLCRRGPHTLTLLRASAVQAAAELATLIHSAEATYATRLAALPTDLARRYTLRNIEATREGGARDDTHPPEGRWCIPAAITDEEGFRAGLRK